MMAGVGWGDSCYNSWNKSEEWVSSKLESSDTAQHAINVSQLLHHSCLQFSENFIKNSHSQLSTLHSLSHKDKWVSLRCLQSPNLVDQHCIHLDIINSPVMALRTYWEKLLDVNTVAAAVDTEPRLLMLLMLLMLWRDLVRLDTWLMLWREVSRGQLPSVSSVNTVQFWIV